MGEGGELHVAGDFWRTGDTISVNVATIVSTCPATAANHAAGCPSSGGSNTLTAVSLPWVNDTFRAEATGLPANALVLTLTSVTPVTPGFPLAALFAEGVPGCDLLVAPDILGITIAVGGMASSAFNLTDTPPIVGVAFYHQMIAIEFDPGTGAWVAITATNALRLVGGVF